MNLRAQSILLAAVGIPVVLSFMPTASADLPVIVTQGETRIVAFNLTSDDPIAFMLTRGTATGFAALTTTGTDSGVSASLILTPSDSTAPGHYGLTVIAISDGVVYDSRTFYIKVESEDSTRFEFFDDDASHHSHSVEQFGAGTINFTMTHPNSNAIEFVGMSGNATRFASLTRDGDAYYILLEPMGRIDCDAIPSVDAPGRYALILTAIAGGKVHTREIGVTVTEHPWKKSHCRLIGQPEVHTFDIWYELVRREAVHTDDRVCYHLFEDAIVNATSIWKNSNPSLLFIKNYLKPDVIIHAGNFVTESTSFFVPAGAFVNTKEGTRPISTIRTPTSSVLHDAILVRASDFCILDDNYYSHGMGNMGQAIAHELGHYLGLNDSTGDENHMMSSPAGGASIKMYLDRGTAPSFVLQHAAYSTNITMFNDLGYSVPQRSFIPPINDTESVCYNAHATSIDPSMQESLTETPGKTFEPAGIVPPHQHGHPHVHADNRVAFNDSPEYPPPEAAVDLDIDGNATALASMILPPDSWRDPAEAADDNGTCTASSCMKSDPVPSANRPPRIEIIIHDNPVLPWDETLTQRITINQFENSSVSIPAVDPAGDPVVPAGISGNATRFASLDSAERRILLSPRGIINCNETVRGVDAPGTYVLTIMSAVRGETYVNEIEVTVTENLAERVHCGPDARTEVYKVSIPVTSSHLDAVFTAMEMWEDANPGLRFVGDDLLPVANIRLMGADSVAGYDRGEIRVNTSTWCAPSRTYEPYDTNHLANLVAHELGHVLGLGHAGDEEHIMYGPESPGEFDSLDYHVPNKLEHTLVLNDNSPCHAANQTMR